MIERIRAALPRRALSVRPLHAAWRGWLLMLLGLVVGGGILAWGGIALLPGVMDDVQMRGRAQPVAMSRVTEGRCSSRLAVLHSCSATLVARTKDGEARRVIEQAFLDFHTGDWTVRVLADPERPGVLTTDVGLERIWHRVATLALLGAFGLLIPFGLWRELRAQGAERRRLAALRGQVLAPVPLRVLGWQGSALTLGDEAGGSHRWTVPPRTRLFVLDEPRGIVLGMRAGGEAYPMDETLRALDLTDHERAAVRLARG